MKLGTVRIWIAAAPLIAFVAGCSKGSGDADPGNSQALSDTATLAKKVDGNYDRLSPAEKQQILKAAGNNEDQARTMLMMAAHPPNERMRNGGGPPGAGAAGGPGRPPGMTGG